jgi:hypothetical protein
VEDVHDEVAEIEQDPATLGPALAAQWLRPVLSLAIATTLRSLRPVARRKMSVRGSGPDTSRATRSSACFESAAAAAIWRSSRACSVAVTGSFGVGVEEKWRSQARRS